MKPLVVHHGGILWPDPMKGPWHIGASFAEVDGRLECVGLDVRSFRARPVVKDGEAVMEYRPPLGGGQPRPVTANLFRSLPVAFLARTARRDLGDLAMYVADQPGRTTAQRQTLRTVAGQLAESPRRVLDDDHFARVAEIYRRAWSTGDSAPTKAVAEQMKASRSAAAKWVARARAMGLLGETQQGKPGAPGPSKTTRKGR